jgi:hypothetical protein
MPPTTTNVEEKEKWRARIQSALAQLQTNAPHIDGRVQEHEDTESASSTDS